METPLPEMMWLKYSTCDWQKEYLDLLANKSLSLQYVKPSSSTTHKFGYWDYTPEYHQKKLIQTSLRNPETHGSLNSEM